MVLTQSNMFVFENLALPYLRVYVISSAINNFYRPGMYEPKVVLGTSAQSNAPISINLIQPIN